MFVILSWPRIHFDTRIVTVLSSRVVFTRCYMYNEENPVSSEPNSACICWAQKTHIGIYLKKQKQANLPPPGLRADFYLSCVLTLSFHPKTLLVHPWPCLRKDSPCECFKSSIVCLFKSTACSQKNTWSKDNVKNTVLKSVL